jgi:metal-responsive CopG/Arc/MetJ family transcriptional regulator
MGAMAMESPKGPQQLRRIGRSRSKKMRTIVFLPESLLEDANAVAKDIGVSRSRLLQAVLEDFLQRRGGETFAEAIDRYLAKRGSGFSEEGEPWRPQVSEQGRQARRQDEGTASRRIVLSFTAGLLEQVDAVAKHLGLSCNDLACAAFSDFLIRHNSSETTRRLNKSYIKNTPEPDPFLDHLVLEGMKRTEWKE